MKAFALALAAGALLSGCTPRKFAGLLPLEPAAPEFVTSTLTPELLWQALPPDPRITDVVYDVKLYASKSLWLEQEGLTEPRYQVETRLTPGIPYEWTVRARYRFDGARRRIEWTEREDTWTRDGRIDEHPRTYIPLTFERPSSDRGR